MQYQLNLEHYQGPIEKLLELIEARELAIGEISLAAVTDDFLKHLERITAEYREAQDNGVPVYSNAAYMRLLSDFIVVASRLIFIKSKSLIPDISLSDEDEADIKDLENRIRLYKELKPLMKQLSARWKQGNTSAGRPYFLHVKGLLLAIKVQAGLGEAMFAPGPSLSVAPLTDSLKKLLAYTKEPIAEEIVVQEKIVTLEAKIKEMVIRIRDLKETTFKGMMGHGSRMEAVVAFIALLHLAREQLVSLEQEHHGSDIIIRHAEPASQA